MESSTELPRHHLPVPPGPPPTFGRLVATYVEHGDREYLARLLQIWSPEIDEDHSLIGGALHHAIFIGDETAVKMILDAGVSPTVQDSRFYTPLATAADAGQREIARLLWQLVEPNGRSANCEHEPSCLVVAAAKGHADLVAGFLDMWEGWSMDEKRCALDTAALEWHDNVVGVLLAKVPYEADAIQQALEVAVTREPILPVALFQSWIPITTAEDNLRQQRVVCQLIDAGANPNVLVYRRIPLLHATAESRHRIGALRGLLEKGADIKVRNKTGKTALHRLFHRPNSSSMDALRVLLQHGPSLPEMADETGETGLHAAAHTGTLEQFQLCLASCRDTDAALHLRTSHGESLLHYAAAGGRQATVEFLLDRGLDVNASNANGWTPLICALTPTNAKPSYPQCSLARLLLQHGADPGVVTDEGWTALHGLASYPSGHLRQPLERWDGVAPLVRELVSRGAPLDAESGMLRNRAVKYSMFVHPHPDAWGFRMRSFARNWASTATKEGLYGVEERETTIPLMWAHRNGATEAYEAMLELQAKPVPEPECSR